MCQAGRFKTNLPRQEFAESPHKRKQKRGQWRTPVAGLNGGTLVGHFWEPSPPAPSPFCQSSASHGPQAREPQPSCCPLFTLVQMQVLLSFRMKSKILKSGAFLSCRCCRFIFFRRSKRSAGLTAPEASGFSWLIGITRSPPGPCPDFQSSGERLEKLHLQQPLQVNLMMRQGLGNVGVN